MSRHVFISVMFVSWFASWPGSLIIADLWAAPKSSCQRALPDYRVAVESYQDGLLDPAVAGFRVYIKKCPTGRYVGQAHYVLATIQAKRTKFAKALSHIKEALSHTLEPAVRPHALLLGAQSAMQLDKEAIAHQYLQQVVTAQADGSLKAPAFYWLGDMANRKQQTEEAQRYYQWAIQESPQGPYAPHAYYSLGWMARQQGDVQAGLAAFAEFLKLAPEHELVTQVRFAQADLLRESGDVKAAAVAFRHLAQDDATEPRDEALFRWAEMAYQLKQYDEASQAYDQLLTQFPKSGRTQDALYGKGWTAIQRQSCEAAIEPWEMLLERDPAFAQAADMQYHLGVCAIQLTRYAVARRYLKQVAALNIEGERQRDITVKLGTLAFRDKAYDEAIQYYSQALAWVSQDASYRIHYLLGESHYAAGHEAQALEHWENARAGEQAQPFDAQVLSRLGTDALVQGDWDRAILILRRLWDDYPAFTSRQAVATGLAQAYGRAQRCEDALQFYTEGGDDRLTSVVDPIQVACLFTLKQYVEIVRWVSPVIAGERADATTVTDALLYTLGQSYMQLQQFEPAVKTFEQLQLQFPKSPLVALAGARYAFALEELGRAADALEVWQQVLKKGEPTEGVERQRLQLHLGRLAVQEKQFDVASTWLAPVRSSSHSELGVEALYWSGEVFRQQQQLESAIPVYLELVRRYPGDAHWVALARLRLGMIYEDQQEWDQALESYQAIRDSAADAEVMANAQRRISAIKAGRVLRHPTSATPSKG